MKWIKKILGFSTPLEKKKNELSSLRNEIFHATRNGNLRKASQLSKKAELLEDKIMEMFNETV